jgi:N-dimethylarginine dimethylaminohydrolase
MLTAQSDVGQLVRVAMKHPRDAFVSQHAIDRQWQALHFLAPPDFLAACREFDALVRILEEHGAGIELLPADPQTGLDAIYARDASLPTDAGIVIGRMGKALRAGEPAAQDAAFRTRGWPILGSISTPGTVEGGDLAWLDHRTLAVGHGYRTNAEGLRQLRTLLPSCDIVVVPLPHWRGEGDVMHLMSLLSPVAPRTLVVYSPLLPAWFRLELLARDFALIEVPDDEFDTMGTNVLAIAPGKVVVLEGNPVTRAALDAAGIETIAYTGTNISVKGSGGPTCLTRPLSRRI